MTILGYLAAVVAGIFTVPLARSWARLMERIAGGYCTCLKGRVDRKCPLHGWERENGDRDPFPGASPW